MIYIYIYILLWSFLWLLSRICELWFRFRCSEEPDLCVPPRSLLESWHLRVPRSCNFRSWTHQTFCSPRYILHPFPPSTNTANRGKIGRDYFQRFTIQINASQMLEFSPQSLPPDRIQFSKVIPSSDRMKHPLWFPYCKMDTFHQDRFGFEGYLISGEGD